MHRNKRKHRKHRSRPTIRFFSKKNHCPIWCQSYLEMLFALLLEFDDDVESYASQVESIHSPVGSYTPDFLVKYVDGTSFHFEVHHPALLNDEYQEKFAAYQQYIREHSDEPLTLITDLGVSEQALKTLQNLYYFKNKFELKTILCQLTELPVEISFEQLAQYLGKFHRMYKQLLKAMLAEHWYIFDIDKPLTNDSLLYRNY
ncbi:hypothetical protein RI845_16050 [Thalassotalea nanhaiensis]|uniref:TnsA endonuclease N-terminal domain-containing protein n=1 Tax=Thalassotalea nanhaiensis TaxID=3065648 RepID=A0ABY9TGV7_9GAMM|nr:hypothetical protein RI845_16050 [Colwelliaceae bacterium SQ345]